MSRFTDLFSQTEQPVVEEIHVVEEVHEEPQVVVQETVVDTEVPKSNSKGVSTTLKKSRK